jgi:hypothetical protein
MHTRGVYRDTGSRLRAGLFAAKFLRRKVPRALRKLLNYNKETRFVGRESSNATSPNDHINVAIWIGGVIGDHAVIARFLRDITVAVEKFEFDVFSGTPDHAEWLFSKIKGFRTVYRDSLFDEKVSEYDLGIRLDQAAILEADHIKWAKLARYSQLSTVCMNILNYRQKIEPFLSYPFVLADALARHAIFEGASRRNFLHKMANITYGGDRFDIAVDDSARTRFSLAGRKYLTVNNGFDRNFILSSRQHATKCYPHFDQVLRLLKAKIPGLFVVQIGTSTSKVLSEADLNLIGKTNLREVADILGNSLIHLDGEGGLVHLARSLGVSSCVIFGPTPVKYFGYPENLNIEPTFCGGCWWVTDSWMDSCPRKLSSARCMTEQDPRAVARAVAHFLANNATTPALA